MPIVMRTTMQFQQPQMIRSSDKLCVVFDALIALSLLSGCGSGNGFSTTQPSGKITYEDGSLIPAAGMQLRLKSLASDDPNVTPRTGMISVNVADGTFNGGMTYKPDDGVIAGKHKVGISLTGKPGQDIRKLVPKDYISAASTPVEVDTAELPWDIKIPKP
jgi:hypothetical protein